MPDSETQHELERLRCQVAALEQLLDVHERTVVEQSVRLEKLRREAEQRANALHESEERFKTLVENAPEAILVLDVDQGRFLAANPNALQLFGMTHAELTEKHPVDLSPPTQPDGRSSSAAAGDWIEQTLQGANAVFEWVHRSAQGEDIACEIRLVRLPAAERQLVRASIIDIADRKRTERALRNAQQLAETANQAKSRFLASVSHEVRSPLNAIIGIAELLRDGDLTENQRDYVSMICESGETLLALINELLDLAKIEAGKLEFRNEDFHLRSVLHNALKPLSLRACSKALEFHQRVSDNVPDSLNGDSGRLQQIVVNLVTNAIKFTERGCIVVGVDCLEQRDGRAHLHFTVCDTGMGIPRDQLARVFEAFEQLEAQPGSPEQGTGLGLAIVSKLVSRLGGEIWVESEVGQGTTFHFTIRLPISQAAAGAARQPAVSPGAFPELPRSRILVVEDSEFNQRLIIGLLNKWGQQPTMAADGLLGLRAWESQEFDLILMDLQMPHLNGLQLTRRIRELEHSPQHIPIVALTAHAFEQELQECLDAGMDACVTKPIRAEELRRVLAKFLPAPRTSSGPPIAG